MSLSLCLLFCTILGGDRGGGGDRGNNSNLMPAGEVEVQQFPDTIFIQGLADDVSEELLTQTFGALGKLKVLDLFSQQDNYQLSNLGLY